MRAASPDRRPWPRRVASRWSSPPAAQASQEIESFSVDALDHPGRRSPRPRQRPSRWKDPGQPEAARNVIFNTPEGVFGNPNAITAVHLARTSPCSSARRLAGRLITVRANYEGNPDYLLGTAPIFDLEPGDEQTALFAFIVADPQHPDHDPGRGAHRRRLRAALHGLRHHPDDPARRRRPRPSGASRRSQATTPSASPKARPGNPAGCPGLATPSCIAEPRLRADRRPPADQQPDHLHRASR